MSDAPLQLLLRPVERFLATESASGVILIVAALVAFAWANSPWAELYGHLQHVEAGITLGGAGLHLSLAHWVNDGLMAIFFFVVGLEIKRELLVGELAGWQRAALPIVAALGGMVVPAAIYAWLNLGQPTIVGWGVPMATDIAFAVGILALLGPRVPLSLKIFLLALAIVDDLGAVLVIVIDRAQSPLHEYEHALQPWVAYGIMPLFALFNAGVTLGGEGGFGNVVTLGAFLGLLIGKPVGITLFVAIAIALGVTRLPSGVGWAAITGVGLLGGIGFTMALFIAMLAFGESPALDQAKIGVLAASVCAAVIGYLVLRMTLAPAGTATRPEPAPVTT